MIDEGYGVPGEGEAGNLKRWAQNLRQSGAEGSVIFGGGNAEELVASGPEARLVDLSSARGLKLLSNPTGQRQQWRNMLGYSPTVTGYFCNGSQLESAPYIKRL